MTNVQRIRRDIAKVRARLERAATENARLGAQMDLDHLHECLEWYSRRATPKAA